MRRLREKLLILFVLMQGQSVQGGEIPKITIDNYPDAIIRIAEYLERNMTMEDPCAYLLFNPPKGNESLAVIGAQRILASYYQSCKALTMRLDNETKDLEGVRVADRIDKQSNPISGKIRKLEDKQAFVASHVLLRELNEDETYPAGENCRDMTETPPMYGYGSRMTLDPETQRLNIFQSGGGLVRDSEAVAVDCSSFIAGAMAAAGLRINKNGADFEELLTTSEIQSGLTRRNSCLKPAVFEAEETIQPGDMINVSANHVVMIDSVSDDPLGIKKHSSANTCDKLMISDFDFTYIHSGADVGSYGPSRVHISAHDGGTMFNNLRLLAVSQCKRLRRGRVEVVSTRQLSPSKQFGIARHQSQDPDCLLPERIKIQGEECLGDCLRG